MSSAAVREPTRPDQLLRIYAVVAVVALIAVFAYAGTALFLAHGRALEQANSDFAGLNGALTRVYLEQRTFSAPAFRASAANALTAPDGPEAIVVLSRIEGVAYAAAIGAGRIVTSDGEPTAIAQRPFLRVLQGPFRGARELELQASYPLLQADDAFPILRSVLFGVLVFVLLSGIAFVLRAVLRPSPHQRPQAAGRRERQAPKAPTRSRGEGSRKTARREVPSAAPGSMVSASGISKADFLNERLNSELTRAGGLDSELCLALVVGRGINGNRQRYLRLGAILREVVVVPDLAFEYGESGFALIMPETELGDAIERLGSVRSLYHRDGRGVEVAIGLSQRGGRLIDGKRIFTEARRALQKAVTADGNHLVGFRADPVKFRRQQSTVSN